MLSRSDFCILTKLDSDALKNRTRRGQLPDFGRERRWGSYTAFDALLTVLTDELAENFLHANLVAASGLVSAAAGAIRARIAEIARTGDDLANGIGGNELLVALVEYPFGHDRVVHVGTLAEITVSLGKASEPIIRMVMMNASRAAAVMVMRATRENVALGDDWVS
jgi:hypothetical protein